MSASNQKLEDIQNIQQILESRWAALHSQRSIFRYQLTIERERITDGRINFLLQLNRKRTTERRKPDLMETLIPPFDPNKFNFNKVDPREVLAEVRIGNVPVSLLINNSPLTKFHSLVVPRREQNLPQVLTEDSLLVAVRLLMALDDRCYRIGYNSSGALASVNHLHLHLMHISHKLYVEDVPLTALGKHVSRLDNYPAKAYCLILEPSASEEAFAHRIYQLVNILLSQNLAHNLFLTWGTARTSLRALLYPRLQPCENKQVSPFNVAFCELSGFVPLGEESDFERMDESALEQFFRQAQGDELYQRLDEVVLNCLGG